MGIPTLGIVSHPKHKILYDKIGMTHRRCSLDQEDFLQRLEQEVQQVLQRDENYLLKLKEEYQVVMQRLSLEKEHMLEDFKKWLEKHQLHTKANVQMIG